MAVNLACFTKTRVCSSCFGSTNSGRRLFTKIQICLSCFGSTNLGPLQVFNLRTALLTMMLGDGLFFPLSSSHFIVPVHLGGLDGASRTTWTRLLSFDASPYASSFPQVTPTRRLFTIRIQMNPNQFVGAWTCSWLRCLKMLPKNWKFHSFARRNIIYIILLCIYMLDRTPMSLVSRLSHPFHLPVPNLLLPLCCLNFFWLAQLHELACPSDYAGTFV